MKERLDTLLVERGIYQSRERAKSVIMAGVVYVDGQKVDKAGTFISTESEITVKEDLCPYVSRGGLKLQKALDTFQIDLSSAIGIDIGASTGGFTDCMLQRGADKVYSIDVGYGQLDWKLRNDPRVNNMEKVNIRYLAHDRITERADFISIDVSFISLKLVFPVAFGLLKEGGNLICLVKPQFEAGREQVGKNGIVREPSVHISVIERVIGFAEETGFQVRGLTYSPMTGAKGNIEYLLHLGKTYPSEKEPETLADQMVESDLVVSVVKESHDQLAKK